jgi:hypothetical protein
VNDDFHKPKQWASGTGIAQASEGATAIVYNGPSVGELVQAISAAMFPGVSGSNHLLVTVPRLVSTAPVAPSLPLPRRTLILQLTQAIEREHAAVLIGDLGSGRSELARSYAENLQQVFWLDLETNAQLPPSLAMEIFLQSVSGVTPSERTSASAWGSTIPALLRAFARSFRTRKRMSIPSFSRPFIHYRIHSSDLFPR